MSYDNRYIALNARNVQPHDTALTLNHIINKLTFIKINFYLYVTENILNTGVY